MATHDPSLDSTDRDSTDLASPDLDSPDLDSPGRALPFPLGTDHRAPPQALLETLHQTDLQAPLQDGSACPHCAATHVQKWGTFSGRQRYRCCDCRCTFSPFTGTALHYLKRPDRWPHFLRCVDERLTVRSSAAVLGVHKDTALRWRHRLLDQWRNEPRPRLKGRIVIGHFHIPHSDKGRRPSALPRPPRRRREEWWLFSAQTDPVTVLVAWEGPGAMLLDRVGVRSLRPRDYDDRIAPRLRDVTEIVGCGGPDCPVARFARRMGVPYQREGRTFLPPDVFFVRRELQAWLRPFHGVATRRLHNYLEWFRRCRAHRSVAQQFPRTATYWKPKPCMASRAMPPPGREGVAASGPA